MSGVTSGDLLAVADLIRALNDSKTAVDDPSEVEWPKTDIRVGIGFKPQIFVGHIESDVITFPDITTSNDVESF